MKQIRRGTFETNSSSTHSISFISDDALRKLESDILYVPATRQLEVVDFEGVPTVFVELGRFDWGPGVYNDPYTKLSYLLTKVAHYYDIDNEEDLDDFYNGHEFDDLNKIVSDYFDGAQLRIDNTNTDYCCTDHDMCLADIKYMYEDKNLYDFVFDPNIVLTVTNDNETFDEWWTDNEFKHIDCHLK
jgi:hypothetical protein